MEEKEAVKEESAPLEEQENKETPEETPETPENKVPEPVPYERFKEVLDKHNDLKEQLSNLTKEEKEEVAEKPQSNLSDEDWRNQIEFLATNRDVSKEELQHLVKVRDKSETLDETYTKEKEYLTFRKQQAEDAKKVPESSASGAASPEPAILSTREGRIKFAQEQEAKIRAQKGRGDSSA